MPESHSKRDPIPIAFEHEGITYKATLNSVSGAGADGNSWHLMINKFYFGQLRITNYGWALDGKFEGLADYFGQYLIAWYDGVCEK